MSLRWRADGRLLCGAKSDALPGDVYIDDGFQYRLSEAGLIVPMAHEATTGAWRWATWLDRLRGRYWDWFLEYDHRIRWRRIRRIWRDRWI